MHLCEHCQKPTNNPRFCSRACTLSHVKQIVHPCVNCQKPTNNPRFCSKTCSAIHTNKERSKHKRTLKCSCGKLRLARHKRCPECIKEGGGGSWPRNALRNRKLAEVLEMPSVKGKHPSWACAHIRQLARDDNADLLKLPCPICGYAKHVELCHIKPISSFPKTATIAEVNDRSNLIILCRNCHWELDHGLLNLAITLKTEFGLKIIKNHKWPHAPHTSSTKRKEVPCLTCGTFTKNKAYCSPECFHNATRKGGRPDKEKLKELLKHKSFTSVGKMYDVSDNAIRKWIK